ncbi:hypothetical protein HK101_002193, partial [Irineochytrium annulatum]
GAVALASIQSLRDVARHEEDEMAAAIGIGGGGGAHADPLTLTMGACSSSSLATFLHYTAMIEVAFLMGMAIPALTLPCILAAWDSDHPPSTAAQGPSQQELRLVTVMTYVGEEDLAAGVVVPPTGCAGEEEEEEDAGDDTETGVNSLLVKMEREGKLTQTIVRRKAPWWRRGGTRGALRGAREGGVSGATGVRRMRFGRAAAAEAAGAEMVQAAAAAGGEVGAVAVVAGRKGGLQSVECAICRRKWRVGQKVCTMPCDHSFHIGCIGSWLEINPQCPMCRRSLRECRNNH